VGALPPGSAATETVPGTYVVRGPGDAVGPDLLAAVTAWCAAQAVMPQGLTVGAPAATLESVFLALTGTGGPAQDQP
jgi:ABC-2 type transport system ATP-binding protein